MRELVAKWLSKIEERQGNSTIISSNGRKEILKEIQWKFTYFKGENTIESQCYFAGRLVYKENYFHKDEESTIDYIVNFKERFSYFKQEYIDLSDKYISDLVEPFRSNIRAILELNFDEVEFRFDCKKRIKMYYYPYEKMVRCYLIRTLDNDKDIRLLYDSLDLSVIPVEERETELLRFWGTHTRRIDSEQSLNPNHTSKYLVIHKGYILPPESITLKKGKIHQSTVVIDGVEEVCDFNSPILESTGVNINGVPLYNGDIVEVVNIYENTKEVVIIKRHRGNYVYMTGEESFKLASLINSVKGYVKVIGNVFYTE